MVSHNTRILRAFKQCGRVLAHVVNRRVLSHADGVREETSAHILCECEALASLRHMYLGSFFLEPEDIRSLGLGAIWNFSKATGLP